MFQHSIQPVSHDAARQARERLDHLTKPVGSLGRIEDLAERLASIHGDAPLARYDRRCVLIFAGDHGVVAQGVSAYPSEVTPQMVGAFLAGFAAINAFARSAGAQVFVVNVGVASPLPVHNALFDLHIANGTRDFSLESALTDEEVDAALAAGARAVTRMCALHDPQVVALGEMGIGNTTSAAAIVTALIDADARDVVGRGTGVDDAGIARKLAAIDAGLARVDRTDWRSVAREVGGLEILGLTGAILELARLRIPILLDGFIVSAAALVASRIAPASIGYCIAAHRSHERGHVLALRALDLVPLLELDLRLGEASGAALAFGLIDAAGRMYHEMKTFAEAGVATALETA